MNQINNEEENILDIDELYDIASRLKESKDEKISTKAVLKKNQSQSMNERYTNAKEDYIKALNDFNFFVKNYVRINDNGELKPLNINKVHYNYDNNTYYTLDYGDPKRLLKRILKDMHELLEKYSTEINEKEEN